MSAPTLTVACPVCERPTVDVYIVGRAVDQWDGQCRCHASGLVDQDGYHERVVEAACEEIRAGAHTYAEHLAEVV